MNIHLAIRWVKESSELIDGATFTSSNRTRASVGLLHLSLEHNRGIISCIEHGIWGSAFALFRCQFESLVRGLWVQCCATDEEVNGFLDGREPPRIKVLLEAIEQVSGFESGALTAAKAALWTTMNDYTHGGAVQVKARNTESDIVVNYDVQHVEAVLEYSVHLAYTCGVEIAKICDSEELANELMALHKEIN
jgi:hypothetical protein